MKKRHSVAVEGFHGSLEDLAKLVCRMRYDKVALFFNACAEELNRQACADARRSRPKLAQALHETSEHMLTVRLGIGKALAISTPHMREELAADPDYLAAKDFA